MLRRSIAEPRRAAKTDRNEPMATIQTWTPPDLRSLSNTQVFRKYCALFSHPAWNRALSILYAARSYEAALKGARTLVTLTEHFKAELDPHQYERNLIRIALLELTCLDRLDRLAEYLEAWEGWRIRRLALFYKLSRRGDPRIMPFVLEETDASLVVHFLYLTWGRKRNVEGKIGLGNFKRHARQEDLTEEDLGLRLRE
jgi:hypothetical protein